MKQLFFLLLLSIPINCLSQTDVIQFKTICTWCDRGFPDSTIIAVRVNPAFKEDTISDFRIELVNYYTHSSFFDEKNQMYIFIGVDDFGTDGYNGATSSSYQVLVYAIKNNTITLVNQYKFDALDYVNHRLSFLFLEDKLLINRGDKTCIVFELNEFIDPEFEIWIPSHNKCH